MSDRFVLEFEGECPYELGSIVTSPVKDGSGRAWGFEGVGIVVALKHTTHRKPPLYIVTIEYEPDKVSISDQPTTRDLILLEVRDLTASQDEFRMALNAISQELVGLKGRVKELEGAGPSEVACRECVFGSALIKGWSDSDECPSWTGTIDGLEGELTITPPPKWEGIPP